ADVARVHVLDTPMKSLEALAFPESLAEIVPDLKQRGNMEVRSELALASPLKMHRVDSESDSALALEFPPPTSSIALRPFGSTEPWMPYLHIEFRLKQIAKPEIHRPTPSSRALSLAWQGEAAIDVSARFADGYTPMNQTIHTDRIRDILADGWREWTE